MIVIVTGSRNWNNYNALRSYIDHVCWKEGILYTPHLIVHGDARGADQLANEYAIQHGIPVKAFPADWALGNKAGPIRNQQMIDWALRKSTNPSDDVESAWTEVICIAFPVPQSKGTWDCIRRCERAKIKTYVWGFD